MEAVGAETVGGATEVVVDAAWLAWCGCVVTVVAVDEAFPWWGGEFEWIPMTMRTTIRTLTAAIAASGPPRRRGRRLMECMTRSSEPLMNDAGTGSSPASSNVTGSAGFGTGGGGTGGTTALPGSVRRTDDDPATRNALAGERRVAVAVLPAGGRSVSPDLLERVQLAVVALHRVHVVVGAAAEDHGRDGADDDEDTDDLTDQHRPIFNRISGAGRAAPSQGARRRSGEWSVAVGDGDPGPCRRAPSVGQAGSDLVGDVAAARVGLVPRREDGVARSPSRRRPSGSSHASPSSSVGL